MNTFDIVFNEMQSNGVDCDIKKKDQYGNLVSVKKNELEALGTKSIIASTSKLLMKLNKREQLVWALETKDDGNQLFKRGLFNDAMNKYVEALAAADFGNDNQSTITLVDSRVDEVNDEGESIHHHHVINGNVNELVIPILCNLAACCIELKEWRKTISFSEQALILRPTCNKALLRKGIGCLNIGEYKISLDCFTVVDEYIKRMVDGTTTATEGHESKAFAYELSQTDINRLPQLMMQARRGAQRQRKQLLQQRSSLMKAFNYHHHNHQDSIVNESSDSYRSNIRSYISSETDDDDNDDDDHNCDRTIVSLSSEKRNDDSTVDKQESRGRGADDDLMSISELLIFLLQLLCDEVMSMLGWRRRRSSSSVEK